MASSSVRPFSVLLLSLLFCAFSLSREDPHQGGPSTIDEPSRNDSMKTHIILLSPHPNTSSLHSLEDREAWYRSFLPNAPLSSGGDRLIYSYHDVLVGFAARLTDREVEAMKEKPGFLASIPDDIATFQTTHTPDFLGLRRSSGLWRQTNFGKTTIIGMLDTGIFPNHKSFPPRGLPSPPLKWKGKCEFPAAECSNKIIGARTFLSGLWAMTGGGSELEADPPYDVTGHGTHVAGTAAGWFVEDADYEGFARGTAAGTAPAAHLAIYKVCGSNGCASSDILKGMDAAVSDGVDIISLSLSGSSLPLHSDLKAIGGFAATARGVLVSISASNNGPSPGTIRNEAPWFLTVGAGTMDRNMVGTVKLGNGEEIYGEAGFRSPFSTESFPLVYPSGGTADPTCSNLKGLNLIGKIVLCDSGGNPSANKAENVQAAGGVAMIVADENSPAVSKIFEIISLPATRIRYFDGERLKRYIQSAGADATAAIIFKGTAIGSPPAPVVASFSGRGPGVNAPSILKPDIIGPGMYVLAASRLPVGERTAADSFVMKSGTSMAAPHLSGIAALLKASHPDWSPAAIKSAIITTSITANSRGGVITDAQGGDRAGFFATGAGQVDPVSADNPGLIYDLKADDYIAYLCSIGYTDAQATAVSGRAVKCVDLPRISPAGLNYPSLSVSLGAGGKLSVSRTVTNVGPACSSYSVEVDAPSGVSVDVSPTRLSFSSVKETKQYTVTFTRVDVGGQGSREGTLTWVAASGKTRVRSPIMVTLL